MKQLLKALVVPSLMVATLAFAFVGTSVQALDPGAGIKEGYNAAGGNGSANLGVSLKDVVNVLLYVIGAVAVIMIVIGGLRYVLSGGDSSAVSGAKNTILYAVVGLIVAILAYAIVNFVLTSFI